MSQFSAKSADVPRASDAGRAADVTRAPDVSLASGDIVRATGDVVRASDLVRAASSIKLVAIDLDGTLLDDSKQVSKSTARALAGLRERGVKLLIASARPPRSVRHIYKALNLDTWQVNYNGAMIWDEPGQKVILHKPMEGKLVKLIVDVARQAYSGVLVTCEIIDHWYTDRDEQHYTTETGRLFKPDVIAPLESFCTMPITKLLLLGPPPVMDALRPELAKIFDDRVSILRTDPDSLQFMDKRVSKGLAVRIAARHYGVAMKQVMSIGDAPNDVGMLQLSGVAVAMENGHDVTKKAAHWIAPSNNNEGVYAALKKFGLCS
jgi:Cof subfamily protein (haloacid dehalogenase superfamily)